ncbi:uncharacterized protein A4U43_C02F7480 [Asparagus officinalis]|uniref:Uncharacterized protein n=1 Tax=Asparagus officinalis TaxID=4686 RepID=A0A5P1FGN1_ASPOF|nr:uncharacterized protein A4U43_C02F7480 [Asparagus officinalis]
MVMIMILSSTKGSVSITDNGSGFFVIEHQEGEIRQRFLRSPDLALADRSLIGIESGDDNLEMIPPLTDLIDSIADRVADIEGLDGPLEVIGDESIERRFRYKRRSIAKQDRAKFFVNQEERVEELTDP